MQLRNARLFVLALSVTVFASCAVVRGQQGAGEYFSDATVTTDVKAKMAADKTVSAGAIQVETLNGTVQLSGFARSQAEKDRAAQIAREAKGAKSVRNDIIVRP